MQSFTRPPLKRGWRSRGIEGGSLIIEIQYFPIQSFAINPPPCGHLLFKGGRGFSKKFGSLIIEKQHFPIHSFTSNAILHLSPFEKGVAKPGD